MWGRPEKTSSTILLILLSCPNPVPLAPTVP